MYIDRVIIRVCPECYFLARQEEIEKARSNHKCPGCKTARLSDYKPFHTKLTKLSQCPRLHA